MTPYLTSLIKCFMVQSSRTTKPAVLKKVSNKTHAGNFKCKPAYKDCFYTLDQIWFQIVVLLYVGKYLVATYIFMLVCR